MTLRYRHILQAAVIACGLSTASCNKFLEEPPSKTNALQVTTAAQLEALLNNFTSFYTEANRTAVYSTDDNGVSPAMYRASSSPFNIAIIQFSTWDTQFLPDDTRELYWSTEYRKIFTANMVISLVETVTGTAEQKAALKADAHFIRAYSYFQLANTYCLPISDATKNEPGLPIKLTTNFEEPISRAPLQKVYEQIEADLAEALKTNVPLVQNGKARHWRANKAAVNGFAARYHLARNNYALAQQFAEAALAEHNALVDYNTEMRYGRTQSVLVNPGKPEAHTFTIQYPYTHDNQTDQTDMIGWKEFLYYRMLQNDSWWYIPSQALLDLYDKDHDLRYRFHMVEGYSYDRGLVNPGFEYPGYVFFYKDRLPSGPTTAEMLLIKAECLARTNKPADAMAALNLLRAKRMEPGSWVDLTASSTDDAITKVLQERRREMPFRHRWADIRRLNNNEYANDDISLTREFYPYGIAAVQPGEPLKTYSLPKGSRRFASPIPRTETIASEGAIEQNRY